MQLLEQNKERFWNKVSIGKPNECWNWLGAVVTTGYGYFAFTHVVDNKKYRYTMSHRFSLMLKLNRIKLDGFCLHDCDNKLCCNPHHLKLGDHELNTLDAIQRNRYAPRIGEQHGRAVLNDDIVRFIREEYPKGNHSHASLGKLFGVGATIIADIVKRKKWKHVS